MCHLTRDILTCEGVQLLNEVNEDMSDFSNECLTFHNKHIVEMTFSKPQGMYSQVNKA